MTKLNPLDMIVRDDEFRALLNLHMASDPCPIPKEQDEVIEALLDRISAQHGYADWIEAFHRFQQPVGDELKQALDLAEQFPARHDNVIHAQFPKEPS